MGNKLVLLSFFVSNYAFGSEWASRDMLGGATSSILYGTIGFTLLLVGYKAFDKISPIDFVVEIKDEHNSAAAILAGSMIIGMGIIISGAIS